MFTDDEMKTIKYIGEPSLVLLGFKPTARIKAQFNVKAPYFIYPDDGNIKGSTAAFHALLLACAEMQQVMIARLIYRRLSIPRFVALLPQLETFDSLGNQETSPGFHLVFLPYADDLRNLNYEATPITDEPLKLSAKKVVDALKLPIKFDSTAISNPALQKHYTVVQAIALEEDMPEEVEDSLQPDTEGMIKHSQLFENFNELALLNQQNDSAAPSNKRKLGEDNEPTVKKLKQEEAEAEFDKFDWRKEIDSGTIKKLTINDLKIYLRKNKLPLTGKKEELINRITQNCPPA
jgi:ATP-dependent DNA helicase 2 subunit 1